MSVRLTTLPSGLRVVSDAMPHVETVALGVWVASGSRHEPEALHGISHLLEHMAFKGTTRRSARAIAEAIENRGGEINAATSTETTSYYARVLKDDVPMALDVLADVLQNAQLADRELEVEREVILQEIAAVGDAPEEVVLELADAIAFSGQPLGRPVLGTATSVAALTRSDLEQHLARHYRAGDMVVAAAGAIDHDDLVRHAAALFGGLAAGRGPGCEPARFLGGARSEARPIEQTHLVIAFEAPDRSRREHVMTAQILSTLLGGGTASRLFQSAREEQGLCYAIDSSLTAFADTGMLSIQAATSPQQVDDLIAVIAEEIAAVAGPTLGEQEVERARTLLRAGHMMGLESSSVRVGRAAYSVLSYGRIFPTEEILDMLAGVTLEDVRALAHRVFSGEPAIAVVGPEASTAGIGSLCERLAAVRRQTVMA